MAIPENIIQRSTAAGELAPALHARADTTRYVTGLRTCRNFFVRKEGGISNRSGLRFVDEVKDSEPATLLRYESPTPGQSVLIEMGDGYFRFFLNGAAVEVDPEAYNGSEDYVPGDLVEEGGVNYYCHTATSGNAPPDTDFWYAMPADGRLEIPHHFEDHVPRWFQSGDVITLTHGEVAPAELVYGGLTSWALRLITGAAWSDPPANGAGTEGAAGTRTYRYVVTAARADTYEETNQSDPIEILTCAEPTPDAPNVLTWDALDGAGEYYVYCDPFDNGVYGFIGTAAINGYNDPGQVPDFSQTPPIAVDLFTDTSHYPHTATSFQQRRVFGRTPLVADEIIGSKVGFPSNFDITSPLQDDDAVRFALAGQKQQAIEWLVPLTSLIVGTTAGVWRINGGDGPIVPGGVLAFQDVWNGVHDIRPIVIGNRIVYVQSRGKLLRDVRFSDNFAGLDGSDLTIFAGHLFEPSTIRRIDYAESPHSIVWCVLSDGDLLGMTYVPEQEIIGWHRHDTRVGNFEEVCVVPEAGEDIAYFIVRRTIDGNTVRYIERMESRYIREGSGEFHIDAFFVDSGLSYAGEGANEFSGLDHLEGQVVAVLADGEVLYDGDPDGEDAEIYTVEGGQITLPGETLYEDVHIGLPIRFGDVATLDLDVQGTDLKVKKKRVQAVTLHVDRTSPGFFVGPDTSHLSPVDLPTSETVNHQFTGQIEVTMQSDWNDYGRLVIRNSKPLPMTILAIIPNVEVGG